MVVCKILFVPPGVGRSDDYLVSQLWLRPLQARKSFRVNHASPGAFHKRMIIATVRFLSNRRYVRVTPFSNYVRESTVLFKSYIS